MTPPRLHKHALAKWAADNKRLGVEFLTEAYHRTNAEKGIVPNPNAPVRRIG